jgi:hypothetical protein
MRNISFTFLYIYLLYKPSVQTLSINQCACEKKNCEENIRDY